MFQLSFLNTGLLIFAAATVLPLLIWLLAKKKPKQVIFSSLRFIKMSMEQEKKRTQLKNILLLIIRMLIILLVALAVARPLFRSDRFKPSKKHPPTAIAILLDTTYSMDYVHEGRSNLDRARDAIKKINALCNPQDRLILITSDEGWNNLHSQIYAGLIPEEVLDLIEVSFSPISFSDMLNHAESKLAETQLSNREIYLLTDGQSHEYPAFSSLPIHLIPIVKTNPVENLSCRDAKPIAQLVEKKRQQTIEFILTNHGVQDRENVLVRIVLGDIKIAEKFVSIPARQSLNQSLAIDLQSDGWQSGYVEVADDRLLHDNRAYFSFPFHLNPRIAVVSAQSSLPFYLDSMLRVYVGKGVDMLRPEQLNLSRIEQYQLFVFYAPGSLSPRLREFILALQKRKHGVLFCLDRSLSQDYKNLIGSLFTASIGAWQSSNASIDYVNKHHYVSSIIADKSIGKSKITDYWSISAGSAIPLLSAGREALALAKDNMLLWAFDPAVANSTFFLDPAYPVFAYRSIEYAGQARAAGQSNLIGDILSADTITLPDKNKLHLAGRAYRPARPGIYKLDLPDGSQTHVAVNIPRSESEFVHMDFSKLKHIKVLGENWQASLFHTRLGHDIWKFLLIAALLLMAVEIIIVKLEEARLPKSPSV
ncbi:MAG: BatA domain-containing protein [Candidatus Cloacimonadaceae bacterium]|nr:BatA domain-containing protein [Candidatus Cloacimonadaceae bacterium]